MANRPSQVPTSSRRARIVVRRSSEREQMESGREVTSSLLAILGLAFVLIGVVDLALLWIPTRFESVAWEYATVGRTLDNLPMAALGLGLVAFGVIRHPKTRRAWGRGFAVVFLVVAAVVALMSFLFVTATPAVMDQTPPQAMEGVVRSTVRYGVAAFAYVAAFTAAGVLLWRSRRPG